MYDFLAIGSSPISVREALWRCDNGEWVCIVEKSERIGGAWCLVDVFGWRDVQASSVSMRID